MTCHNRRHSKAQPYVCPHCDQTYATLSGLRCHILRSGLHSGKCLYHCTWCRDFATNTRTCMSRHLYEKHPKIMPRDRLLDVHEVLGIYRPEEDVMPMDVNAANDPSSIARRPDDSQESHGGRLGVRIAPKDQTRSPLKTAVLHNPIIDTEREPCKAFRGSAKLRDQLVQAGIGLWTKGNMAKCV